MEQKAKPIVIQLGSLSPLECPCGESRRAFFNVPNPVASVHLVEIKEEAVAHYHKKTTEIYIVLEGEGFVELDGENVPVKPLSVIYIPPLHRHRAIGRLKILNIPIPPFDPGDEWID
ncbi:MAG: cupin domain-containing protein [Verrucomicrobiia bacterium]|jgi:mannose-6-phosphate isomerase-like protein (cupin superfamily)